MEHKSVYTTSTLAIRSRTDIINQLIGLFDYQSYLEIGVRRKADNFDLINCRYKVAVDPNHACEYKMTSDQFFACYDRLREFDLIFIDGLHTKEQSMRDVMNSLASLSPQGAIVVHDCNPTSEYLARPYSEYKIKRGAWNGAVWKTIAELRMTRADLEIFTFDVDCGTAVLRRGRQKLFVAPGNNIQLDYAFLAANRKPLLNLVKPGQFMQLMGNGVSTNVSAVNKIDVVYTLGEGSKWDDNELRYSLRSLEKHFDGPNKVWVVGAKPRWLKNVRHLPYPGSYKNNKDANLINAIIRVCLEPALSREFLLMSDDQCLLSPVKKEDFKTYYMHDMYESKEWKASRWQQRLKRTFEVLKAEGKPAYHLDAHVPYLYDKEKFPGIMLAYDYGAGNGYTINSLYLNNCLEEKRLAPELQVNRVRAALGDSLDNERAIMDIMSGKKFLMYSDKSLTPSLKKVLARLFPDPSKYESA